MAVAAAGLDNELEFRATPKILRATGATLLLQLGIPIPTVMAMGGWKNADVLMRSYMRSNDQAKIEAAADLGRRAMEELGLASNVEDLEAPILRRQATVLLERIAGLEAALEEFGVDPSKVSPVNRAEYVKRPPTVWQDIERVLHAIDTMPTQRQMLMAIGAALSPTSYRLLRAIAGEHGRELPRNWGKRFDWEADIDGMKEIIGACKSQSAVLTKFGVSHQVRNYQRLRDWAYKHGVDLPPMVGGQEADRLADDETLRAAIRSGRSRRAILLGIGKADSLQNRTRLERRAEELGEELPPLGGHQTGHRRPA